MSAKPSQKLLVIALDGLSLEQLQLLAFKLHTLSDVVSEGTSLVLDTTPLVSAQAIWSEILTGRPWFESGCSGYARPSHSLNQSTILTDKDLNAVSSLVFYQKPPSTVCINLPLVSNTNDLVWLGDGSLPGDIAIAPAHLRSLEPFASYRARPYATSIHALADIAGSVRKYIDVERQRLLCAQELVKDHSWRTFFLRLSIFDHLAHLIGDEFLQEHLSVSDVLWKFLEECFSLLSAVVSSAESAHICLISAYSHTRCTGRLNLNRTLESHGLCKLLDGVDQDSPLQRRLAGVGRLGLIAADTSTSPPLTDLIDSRASLAGSPAYGAVYLNTSSRFMDGPVVPSRADDLAKTVFNALRTSIVKRLQLDLDIWSSHVVCPPVQHPPAYVMHYRWRTGKMHMTASRLYEGPEARAVHPLAPDIMIHVPGIELSDSGPPLFDPNSYPRATHYPCGFALFLGKDVMNDGAIRPTQLHAMLESLLE